MVKTKNVDKSEKISFWDVFELKNYFFGSNVLQIKHNTKIGGITLDKGSTIKKGVTLDAIDFYLFIGRDLSVIKEENYWLIVGIY